MSKYWFKRRRYGWGWIPSTWQGWSLVAAYAAILIGGSLMLEDAPEDAMSTELGIYLLIAILATAGLVQISWRKGPRPRWRWGKSPKDNPEEDF